MIRRPRVFGVAPSPKNLGLVSVLTEILSVRQLLSFASDTLHIAALSFSTAALLHKMSTMLVLSRGET